MINVFYDAYRILFKVYSEGAFLKQAISDVAIDYKNRNHVTKIVYGVLDKDVSLEYYLSYLCDKRPKQAVRIILKIALYSIRCLNNAPYSVVDASVELVKKLGKGANAGFVNAVLRKFSVVEIPLPKEETERLSVIYSYPVFAVKRLVSDYGLERAKGIMSADTERTTVRFNGDADGENYLLKRGYSFEKTPFENCFFVDGFKRNEDYDAGVYTFQSVGSVAVCDLVGTGKRLLDACAAPGGKSVNLSDKFSEVVSCDVYEHRVKLIEEYAARMKKTNVTAVLSDSTKKNADFCEKFDVVLCDAPCSGYGVIKDNPDVKLNRTDKDIEELNKTQLDILLACCDAVSFGGYLCYSTCSVFKAENDGIIEKFLKNRPDFEIEDCISPLPFEKEKYGVGFFPDISFGAGFYFCKMKRKNI